MYPNQVPQSIQQAKKQTQMESQQDIVDLTINDNDDSLFPTELSETVNSLLKMDGMEGNKETAKQNHEDDTLSIYGSEDSEIATDEEEEKEEESKKIIFKRIWPNFGKKPRKATFQSTVFDVYSCSHETIYPGQMEMFSLGFKMKMRKGYCAKIYGRSGMTVKCGIHLAGGVSIRDPDFRGPISICLKNSHRCSPYGIKVNDWIAQMMIETVDEFKWIEGTEDDFKIKGVSENASEGQHSRKRIRNLEGFGSTGI